MSDKLQKKLFCHFGKRLWENHGQEFMKRLILLIYLHVSAPFITGIGAGWVNAHTLRVHVHIPSNDMLKS